MSGWRGNSEYLLFIKATPALPFLRVKHDTCLGKMPRHCWCLQFWMTLRSLPPYCNRQHIKRESPPHHSHATVQQRTWVDILTVHAHTYAHSSPSVKLLKRLSGIWLYYNTDIIQYCGSSAAAPENVLRRTTVLLNVACLDDKFMNMKIQKRWIFHCIMYHFLFIAVK